VNGRSWFDIQNYRLLTTPLSYPSRTDKGFEAHRVNALLFSQSSFTVLGANSLRDLDGALPVLMVQK